MDAMEKAGKCSKKPDIQYYKPPKMVNRVNSFPHASQVPNHQLQMLHNQHQQHHHHHHPSSHHHPHLHHHHQQHPQQQQQQHHHHQPKHQLQINKSNSLQPSQVYYNSAHKSVQPQPYQHQVKPHHTAQASNSLPHLPHSHGSLNPSQQQQHSHSQPLTQRSQSISQSQQLHSQSRQHLQLTPQPPQIQSQHQPEQSQQQQQPPPPQHVHQPSNNSQQPQQNQPQAQPQQSHQQQPRPPPQPQQPPPQQLQQPQQPPPPPQQLQQPQQTHQPSPPQRPSQTQPVPVQQEQQPPQSLSQPQHQNPVHRPAVNHDIKNKVKHDQSNQRPSWTMHDQRGSQSGYNNDRSRNKKFNRPDHKSFEQNLPPRLQRKLAMEKANLQSRNSRQAPNIPNPNPSHEFYPNQGTRGMGHNRLPQETNMNNSHYLSSISHSDRHRNMVNDSHNRSEPPYGNPGFQQQGEPKNWINANQPNNLVSRQMCDPCGTNKPCVIIRPTTHQPYQPNDQQQRCVMTMSGLMPVPNSEPLNRNHPMQINSTSNDIGNPKNWSSNSAQRIQTVAPQYDSSSENTRRKLVEKNMNEIMSLETELQNHLLQYPALDEKTVKTLRWKIQQRYQSIIVADPKFCVEHNVELSLWKTAFYQFIEMRRRELEETSESEVSKDELLKLTEEATLFFESLLVMLQDAFNFTIDNFIEHHYDPEKPGYEMIKLSAISAQKIYLYLGDLARYKEQTINGTNYNKAKSYYSKAQQIAPKNGRPYNQLALLAMYGRRRLDAVYNYMRSLAASNPFQSARESLLSIFDEVRKKYETAESKRLTDRLAALKFNKSTTSPHGDDSTTNSNNVNDFKERLEIWIRPDGTSSKHTSVLRNETEEEELDLLTAIDLNKRFVLSFLHVHGKLFTKTGLDTFNSAVNQMLLELRCLLKRSPFPMSSQRLLQLMAISMFSVYQSSFIDNVYQPSVRSSLQEQSIQVILALVSLLLDRVDNSLKEHISKGAGSSSTPHQSTSSSNVVSDDIVEMLPAIKVWTDWMSCQKQFWSPPLSNPGFRIGARGDIWTLFGDVLTRLGDINTRQIKLLPTKFEGCEQVILPEDNILSGFIPLLGAPSALSYVQPPFDKEKARTCLRISRIQFFGDYLCGIPEPYLEFDVGRKRFNSSVKMSNETADDEPECGHNISLDLDDDLEDIPTDSSSGDNANCDDAGGDKISDDPELKELWARQETSRKAQKREEKIRQQLDAILREENRRRLVIQPRFLVPDTNCFIHHLNKLQTLVDCGHFEVIVPLSVINEMNDLMSRIDYIPVSREPCDSGDHEKKVGVGQAARIAYDYLTEKFSDKSSKLKALTSKGSLQNGLDWSDEIIEKPNDVETVLSSCLQFIKKRNSSKQTNPEDSDGAVNIFRETVLLTDDRNLRVKALSHNVPVKSLPVFLQFANLQ